MSPIRMIKKPASQCLVLNETEKSIFSLLRECCSHYALPVTLRVAGGWVRDKLLGVDCKDCDIAIDKMMGQPFAEKFREFLVARNIPTSAFGVIMANPERSKHLETATLTIFGYPIDFVNLRAEAYSHSSRIPTVEYGTPMQDALRRDITINSLFYNIHSDEVEDFCGTGFLDLEQQLIRTPLPPKETLLDDPLRLLRVIRFATRLQFRIEECLQAAIMDEEVDKAFRFKISRERVGAELEKILMDPNALDGLHLMNVLDVFNLIFDVPTHLEFASTSQNVSAEDLPLAPSQKLICEILNLCHSWVPALGSGEERKLALLGAAVLPYRSVMVARKAPKKPEPLTTIIIRDSIKFTNQDYADVNQLLDPLDVTIEAALAPHEDPVILGHLVRRLGRHWEMALSLACIDAITRGLAPNLPYTHNSFATLKDTIKRLSLADCWNWKSVLSGSEVQAVTGIKEGRQVGEVISRLLDCQFKNPRLTKKEAIAYLKSWYPQ